MSFLIYLQKLFSLDTLDTRFTTSSWLPAAASGPVQPSRIDPAKPVPGLDIQDGTSNNRRPEGKGRENPRPSKWATPEFFLYYIVFIVAVPLMFKSVYDVSIPSHPNYSKYEHLLSPGWIPGRKVDNSDQQYSGFRDNIPYMFLLLVFHPLLRRLYESFHSIAQQHAPSSQKISQNSQDLQADARLERRMRFDVGFACLYLLALHGTSALKILVILYVNFTLAKSLPKSFVPLATWVFNIGILFANELCRGYPYAEIVRFLPLGAGKTDRNWGSLLDSYGGLLPRWEVLFNITVLRLISFNLDYHWSLDRVGGSPLEKKQLDQSDLSERNRVDLPAKANDYSFRSYFAYILYSPLYLTGPILTFNDYISQLRYTPRSISYERTMLYGVRLLISLLVMEVMLHFLYAVAISKSQPAWEIYTPFQLSMLGYFNLHHIWLKLLLPWRFFRLWALLDGIDPPENMVRCMSDNYSALAFWRGWHRSYNRWIVRYIYIPLGGSGGPGTHGRLGKARAVANMLVVFTFVALWHDIQLRLLIWGWLITLFVLPEVLAGYAFPKRKWQKNPEAYRIICGIGAVGNVLMMMAANLVGFAVGLDGLRDLVHGIVGSYSGLVYLIIACGALFVGVQVMFELREHELRHVTPLPNHIWIADDVLNHALHRWAQTCVGRRHGSAIPGPLEARKRATRRRIMDLRPTAGGFDLHPGFLAGLNLGQENQQGWQWQAPTPAHQQDHPTDRGNDVALPPWLTESGVSKDDPSPTENIPISAMTEDPSVFHTDAIDNTALGPEYRPRRTPVNQITQSDNLDDMRKIMGKIGKEKKALRRKCSIRAFEHLLRSRCNMDKVLEFLGDRVLYERGARNLTFFVAHCLKGSKVKEMRVLCKWMARQLYVGRYSDSALLMVLQSLFNVRQQSEWQTVLDDFCKNVVQALQQSPVAHTEYLKPKTWSNFVGVLFHDAYSERLVDIGLDFVKTSSTVQLDGLVEKFWPIVEHWIHSWEPSRAAELSSTTLTSKMIILLQILPQDRLVETVTAISWRFLNAPLPKGDLRTFWRKHSIWWSAVRSREISPHIKKSDSWLEVANTLRKRQDEDIQLMAGREINEYLKRGKLRAAHRTLLRHPQVSLDHCPDLAEALILDSERNAKAALALLHKRRSTAFAEGRSASGNRLLEHRRQARADLLERMALAYAKMSHTRPSFAFRCVYECWSLHKQEDLGPVRPGMAQALIQSGIVSPLQTRRRLVSHARLEWILLQVAEAEGKGESRRLAAMAWQWRDEVIQQMEHQRNTKRRDAVEQQWQEQRMAQQESDRWDIRQSPASAGTKASSNRQKLLKNPLPGVTNYDIHPSVANQLKWEHVPRSAEDVTHGEISQQPSPFSPEDEDADDADDYPEPDGPLSSPFEVDISTLSALEYTASGSLKQDPIEGSAYKIEPEGSDHITQYTPYNPASTQNPNYQARCTSHPRTAVQPDSSHNRSTQAMSFKHDISLASPRKSRVAATEQPRRVHTLDSLLAQLNSTPRVGFQGTATSSSPPSMDSLQELAPIPPCSLAAAAVGDNSDTADRVPAEEGRGLAIRRVVGTGPISGMKEREEPTTLSTALQPALGKGIGARG
ncbi:MAG: hypothetical protein Q9225_003239 [Loekoesia sp. 1 TL-2023]